MIATRDVLPNKDGKFACPECGNIQADKAHLGIHRKMRHGIAGIAHLPRSAAREASRQIAQAATAKGHPLRQRRLVDPKQIDKILALHKKGLSPQQVADKMGMPYQTVYRRIKIAGTDSARVTITPKLQQKIRDLREAGFSLNEIANQLNISYSAIQRHASLMANSNGNHNGNHPQERTNGHGDSATPEQTDNHEAQLQQNLVYLFGRLERETEIFALSHEVPKSYVTSGLAKLFQLQASRDGVRDRNRLPALRS